MTSITPAATAPAASASKPASGTTGGDFANLLLQAAAAAVDKDTPEKPSLAGLGDYLGSPYGSLRLQDINTQMRSLLRFVVGKLEQALKETHPQGPPIRLSVGPGGELEIGDHPEKAAIERLLDEHPEWRQALRQAAALAEKAAMLALYDLYLEEYRRAYAKGGPDAANAVSERYLLMGDATPPMTLHYSEQEGYTIRAAQHSLEDWLKAARDYLNGEAEDENGNPTATP